MFIGDPGEVEIFTMVGRLGPRVSVDSTNQAINRQAPFSLNSHEVCQFLDWLVDAWRATRDMPRYREPSDASSGLISGDIENYEATGRS